ncbi:hypothetical protein EON68_05020, partial [archaeon]
PPALPADVAPHAEPVFAALAYSWVIGLARMPASDAAARSARRAEVCATLQAQGCRSVPLVSRTLIKQYVQPNALPPRMPVVVRRTGEVRFWWEPRQGYTCPVCVKAAAMGGSSQAAVRYLRTSYSRGEFLRHCVRYHTPDVHSVVCPLCAAVPHGEELSSTQNFVGHLQLRHFWSYQHAGVQTGLPQPQSTADKERNAVPESCTYLHTMAAAAAWQPQLPPAAAGTSSGVGHSSGLASPTALVPAPRRNHTALLALRAPLLAPQHMRALADVLTFDVCTPDIARRVERIMALLAAVPHNRGIVFGALSATATQLACSSMKALAHICAIADALIRCN